MSHRNDTLQYRYPPVRQEGQGSGPVTCGEYQDYAHDYHEAAGQDWSNGRDQGPYRTVPIQGRYRVEETSPGGYGRAANAQQEFGPEAYRREGGRGGWQSAYPYGGGSRRGAQPGRGPSRDDPTQSWRGPDPYGYPGTQVLGDAANEQGIDEGEPYRYAAHRLREHRPDAMPAGYAGARQGEFSGGGNRYGDPVASQLPYAWNQGPRRAAIPAYQSDHFGFTGRAPKGYERSDERIREDLCERLTEAADIDPSEVSIEVSGGRVTLSGEVEARWMRHQIENLADACPGVRDIDNRLTVASVRSRQQGQGGASNGNGSLGNAQRQGAQAGETQRKKQ
ncbi:BON domain-containing protein [Pseudomarimonas salicorniae]|uniref:BON domain-containing protein n=1 Tax=Pseudomarimonas salicorniae TaxID=2933270 RepID=A0ABT0GL57_9GAMM|nr:BON domain-containing protein [Lysobacter sp. CAU 1642]MCK7595246.1 BON domain-containing protein [Lysobacter sp. CAU 1642]